MNRPCDEGLIRKVLAGLTGFAGAAEVLTHPGPPVPMARARMGKGGRWITPRRSSEAVEAWARTWIQIPRRPRLGTQALVCLFYLPTARRVDADNLTKLVMDSGTAARVWVDDSQITIQTAILELDVEAPRTVVGLAPVSSTLIRNVVEASGRPKVRGLSAWERRIVALSKGGAR
jgi:Holliday junction resolvase RusA-like endonuclease